MLLPESIESTNDATSDTHSGRTQPSRKNSITIGSFKWIFNQSIERTAFFFEYQSRQVELRFSL